MYNKKLTVTVLMLVLAATLASGCTGSTTAQQTTTAANIEIRRPADAQEYLGELRDTFHEYANASFSLTDQLESKNFEDAEKSLDTMEKGLKTLGSIEAPEKYTELQEKLKNSLNGEFEYINNCRKFVSYCKKGDDLSENDIKAVNELTEILAVVPEDFTKTFTELVKTVAEDAKTE